MKKLLVACERSQTVTKAFRKLGYEAWSCDLEESYGDLPRQTLRSKTFDGIAAAMADQWGRRYLV